MLPTATKSLRLDKNVLQLKHSSERLFLILTLSAIFIFTNMINTADVIIHICLQMKKT